MINTIAHLIPPYVTHKNPALTELYISIFESFEALHYSEYKESIDILESEDRESVEDNYTQFLELVEGHIYHVTNAQGIKLVSEDIPLYILSKILTAIVLLGTVPETTDDISIYTFTDPTGDPTVYIEELLAQIVDLPVPYFIGNIDTVDPIVIQYINSNDRELSIETSISRRAISRLKWFIKNHDSNFIIDHMRITNMIGYRWENLLFLFEDLRTILPLDIVALVLGSNQPNNTLKANALSVLERLNISTINMSKLSSQLIRYNWEITYE